MDLDNGQPIPFQTSLFFKSIYFDASCIGSQSYLQRLESALFDTPKQAGEQWPI
jgi:hypothetical protein